MIFRVNNGGHVPDGIRFMSKSWVDTRHSFWSINWSANIICRINIMHWSSRSNFWSMCWKDSICFYQLHLFDLPEYLE